ncbi:hypothetical protein H1S01_00320 [Heliobacterium chlorum]|uniref:Uncharacterized protein n=1 Tax=Heliobacterium chlorum TaxID=2698 RepID=A0ABR7SZ27_HELCL|nr:hypothetical protein [Heliobacterium chlorum]MBC9782950.1 hypothetical protein [Heliobacterium chlorum]
MSGFVMESILVDREMQEEVSFLQRRVVELETRVGTLESQLEILAQHMAQIIDEQCNNNQTDPTVT